MSTLVRDPFICELPRVFGYSRQEFLEKKDPTAWPQFERSELTEEEFLQRCIPGEDPPRREEVHRALLEGYRWIEGIEEILSELNSKGVEMYALSNYPIWYELIEEKLRCSRYFSWRFVSCRTGYRKPEQTCYVNACEKLEIRPSNVLFVDDRPSNLMPAGRLGLRTHQFVDAHRLRSALKVRGFLG